MKGNGLERDTLDGVIEALERTVAKWHNADNQTSFADFRDAISYLHEYRASLGHIAYVEQIRQEFEKARDKHIAALKELEIGMQNDPLTWEDLCRFNMVGQPVWNADRRAWMLIIDSALDGRSWVDLVDNCGKQIRLEPHDLKKYPLYRREKKG